MQSFSEYLKDGLSQVFTRIFDIGTQAENLHGDRLVPVVVFFGIMKLVLWRLHRNKSPV